MAMHMDVRSSPDFPEFYVLVHIIGASYSTFWTISKFTLLLVGIFLGLIDEHLLVPITELGTLVHMYMYVVSSPSLWCEECPYFTYSNNTVYVRSLFSPMVFRFLEQPTILDIYAYSISAVLQILGNSKFTIIIDSKLEGFSTSKV